MSKIKKAVVLGPTKSASRAVVSEAKHAAAKEAARPHASFSEKDLESFRHDLLALRDRLTGKVVQMRRESLRRDDEVNPEEDGTDAFDRLFALERAGSDQELIYSIDEALRAIEAGRYGVCEACSGLIEKPRLHALPFAKNCIACQSELERGRSGRAAGRRALP